MKEIIKRNNIRTQHLYSRISKKDISKSIIRFYKAVFVFKL